VDLGFKRLVDDGICCLELGRVAAALGEVLLSAAASAHRPGDLLHELARVARVVIVSCAGFPRRAISFIIMRRVAPK